MEKLEQQSEQIITMGIIKDVNTKNLVSGDKQTTIKIIINSPQEIVEASKFTSLPHGALVVVSHDPNLVLNI